MEVCIGIDAGTETLKLVMLVDHKIAYYQTLSLGSEAVPAVANSSLQQCLVATGMTARDVNFLGVAGVNAGEVPYSQEIVSEAICHPLGINWLYPDAHTLIDIGASKLIAFKCQKGKAVKMATGDKCASSVGATLRMVSNVLGISLEEMGRLFSRSDEPLTLQSTCSVFLETEIISLLHQKREKPEKILVPRCFMWVNPTEAYRLSSRS